MKKFLFVFVILIFALFCTSCKNEETVPKQPDKEEIIQSEDTDKVEQDETEKIPIDFESLSKKNPDIIGWLNIPGTNVDYPVVMSPNDHKWYLTHDFEGKKDKNGALFCEHMYQSGDFADLVTIIYGHRIDKDKMFYGLEEEFCDNYDELNRLIVYTKTEKLEYEVFAAVPFDNRHIMYWTDFGTLSGYEDFFDEVKNINAISANITADAFPEYGDKVLILSTCLRGNLEKRFLVMAKQIS